jgi:toxin ParE1/3/4
LRIRFLPEAQAEHLQQIAYYESKQIGLGARYLAEVTAALDYICEGPSRFPVVRPPNIRRLGLKVFPFFIIFREVDSIVYVAAIAHYRKRPGHWLARL